MTAEFLKIGGIILSLVYFSAILSSIDAIMKVRTSQGAIAWAIFLVSFPYLALPLYWIFGRSRFFGYVEDRCTMDLEIDHIAANLEKYAIKNKMIFDPEYSGYPVMTRLTGMPFTRYNDATLLVNGNATFGTIFDEIDKAKQYILIQFFIVHDDLLGRELKLKLIRKSKQGIDVYFIFDEIGSYKLTGFYIRDLREAGVRIRPFNTTRGPRNRFQLNFRNHRKIVVIDGKSAFVGGHNVGDEYLGRQPGIGPWRDTHIRVKGPCVQWIQMAFTEDWYWADQTVPVLNWVPEPSKNGDRKILVAATGPADKFETCSLLFVHGINSARHRLWITSPYFVPDAQVTAALQLAALRGVDVRIMLPHKPDHLLVYLSSFSYISETELSGVKFYRYKPGFLHQKVMLIDDHTTCVGTANLDNRSFRLNFEIAVLLLDREFAGRIEKMLTNDFSKCRQVKADELENSSFFFKLAVRIARLLAPIQ